jgi:hypothetical protein
VALLTAPAADTHTLYAVATDSLANATNLTLSASATAESPGATITSLLIYDGTHSWGASP